ncbi:MAG: hypothetical protein KDC38_01260 [Planctomycetes bacterium]|nr:hypothetical protein [Planctomycetota bacterium]
MRALPRGSILLLILALPEPVAAQGVGVSSREPSPFRGDSGQLSGRGFHYTDASILLRSLFRFRPALDDRWARDPSGLRGLAGSVSNDEFYTFQQATKKIAVDHPLFFGLRYLRDEDFDSRFSRTQVGIGTMLSGTFATGGVSASLYSEVIAEKEGIDIQPEVEWWNSSGDRVRLAFVLTDAAFDRKSKLDEYRKRPMTWFLEGTRAIGERARVTTWVNWNPQLERTFETEGFDFDHRSLAGGIEGVCVVSERWSVRSTAAGERTVASRRYRDHAHPDDRRLSRRHWRLEAELRHRWDDDLSAWVGGRYFRLSDYDRRPRDVVADGKVQRRETTLFVGVDWRIHERVLVWPGLYVDFIRNHDDFVGDPGRDDRDRRALVAVALPMEFDVGHDATLTLQANALLSPGRFGGGSLHIDVPF